MGRNEIRPTAALLLAAIVAVAGCGDRQPPPAAPPTAGAVEAAPQEARESAPPKVADDGRSLWATPTAGRPIALDGVADGAQLVLHLRSRRLLATEEGRRVWRALGRLASLGEAAITSANGRPPEEVDRVVVSVAPGDAYGRLVTTLAADPEPTDELPLLARPIEQLLDTADEDRHATLVFSPRFLVGDGGPLIGDSRAPLRRLLLSYCESDWKAVALSLHVDDERLFWELRVGGESETPELRRARALRETIRATPKELRAVVAPGPWSAHAAPLLQRTPGMLEVVGRHARFGAERRQAIVNGYLPASATHNLALAAELLIAELSAPASIVSAEPEAPVRLAERLERRVSVSFDRESLESALSVLSNAMGAPIVIAGRDLQLEGVTRNQMLSVDANDQPAEAILTEMLRQANPDPLATGPADPRQKVVFVVRGDRLVVTTRAAATSRNESLPTVFTKN